MMTFMPIFVLLLLLTEAAPVLSSSDQSSAISEDSRSRRLGSQAAPTIIAVDAPPREYDNVLLKGSRRRRKTQVLKGSGKKSRFRGKAFKDAGKSFDDFGKSVRETIDGKGKGGFSCFHKSSSVRLSDGTARRVDEIEVGDRVASVDDSGELSFVDVVYLPHLKNDEAATFLEVSCFTDGGTRASIRVTEGHFLFVSRAAIPRSFADAVALPADRIVEGDWLWIFADDGSLERCSVANIESATDRGLYSAFTTNGRLIVNDIVASSYAENTNSGVINYNHGLAHFATLLHRVTYQMGITNSTCFRSFNDNILSPLLA